MEEIADSHNELDHFIDRVVDEVYEVIDGLLDETRYILDGEWKECVGGKVEQTEQQRESMEKDCEYLMEMKKMDQEIRQRRKEKRLEKAKLEITPVVPVSGLVSSHFHMYSFELRTTIELWDRSEKEIGLFCFVLFCFRSFLMKTF